MSEALRFPWAEERRSGPREVTPATFPRRTPSAGAGRGARTQARKVPRARSAPPARPAPPAPASARTSRSVALPRVRPLGTGWSAWTGRHRADTAADASDRVNGRVVAGPQRPRHEPDYVLLLSAVALSALGILMILSSKGVETALRPTGSVVDAVATQLFWAVTGAIVLLVTMRMDYRVLRYLSIAGYMVGLGLLVLVLLPPMPPLIEPKVVGGAARWLSIGGLPPFHPAELAKLLLVVYLAHWLASRGSHIGSLREGTIPFLLIAGPFIGLVALEPDLGTTGVVALTSLAMFFVAGASLWQLALVLPLGLVGAVLAMKPYQLERLMTFLDPWSVASGEGFQTVHGLYALGIGGLTGIGLGESNPLAGGLPVPNADNDFIFAIVGQELGLAGGLGVIVLFTMLAWRGLRVALAAPDTFGGLLALGTTAWLAFQAFINIGVVVNLLPLTGLPLPFVSDGGTSLLVSLAAVGILLSISRETSRGSQQDEDHGGGRWHRRPHLPSLGRRAPARPRPS